MLTSSLFDKTDADLWSWLEQFDPGPTDYVRHGLKRMAQTLRSIPATQGPVLELGCDSHFSLMLTELLGLQVFPQNLPNPIAAPEKMDERVVTFHNKATGKTSAIDRTPFNVEKDKFPFADGFFDGALCCELLEHLLYDPAAMLWETNRVLKPGGWLLLTTPNLTAWHAIRRAIQGMHPLEHSRYFRSDVVDFPIQHTREYAVFEVVELLQSAGFSIESLVTYDLFAGESMGWREYLVLLPAMMIYNALYLRHPKHLKLSLRKPHIFALARKSSAPTKRYPEFLYI